MNNPEQITIIGAGLMGHGIAQIFATSGHPVRIFDSNKDVLNSSMDRIGKNLKNMKNQGFKFEFPIDDIINNVKLSDNLQSACKDSDFVFEAVFENLELKQQIFTKLDKFCESNTILCSNTSVISITEIAKNTKHQERILGTHFWNPPYLIPLVEVIRTEMTAEWCATNVYKFLKRVGKHPVYVFKDVPGFIGNRMQHALWREAFAIIDEGICKPETIDEVIRNGFGLRLPFLGPVESADMVGLDLILSIHNYILQYLNADSTPSNILKTKVKEGKLGFKSGGSGFLNWSESSMAKSKKSFMEKLIKIIIEKQKD